ncbi:unnamed protein product [Ectocarpus fasciculatus]
MMMVDRAPIVGRSLPRDPLDNNKARSRGLSFLPPRHADGGGGGSFRPTHHHYHHHHHRPSFSNHHHEHHQHPHHHSAGNGDRHSSNSSRPPHHPHSAHRKNGSGSGRMYHASSSRGAGGGPSTGGAAVPSYGGQGPSSRGGAPGFAWAGAGGRPVSSSGGPSAEYERRSGGGGGSGMRATKAGGHGGFDDGRSLSSSSSQAYSRQGPAIGDDRGSALGRQRGGGGGNGGPAAAAAAAAAGGGAGGDGVTDKDHALALFGLSALCQVASATESPAHDKEAKGQMNQGGGSGSGGRGSRRLFDGADRQQHKRHRGVGPEAEAEARSRRGWAVQESSGDDHEEEEEEEEEDGVTSAERDDSSISNHRRSPSNSSCVSSSSSLVSSADSSDGGFGRHHNANTNNGVFVQPPPPTAGAKTVPRQQQQQRTSGSGGVFCPTWDWGRAACEPAIRLPGSFVDRRFEEVDQQVVKDDEDDDDDESSRAEEEEREEGKSRQEYAQESDDEGPQARPDASSAAHRRGEAMTTIHEASPMYCRHVSASLAGTDEPRPTPTVTAVPRPRNAQADMKAEADVGLDGIGAFFSHFCSAASGNDTTKASESVFLATVANSGDGGLREMAVFCAGPAGKAPDAAPAAYLAREVSLFLQSEDAVAQDLRVYAEALDPAAVDVVVESLGSGSKPAAAVTTQQPLSTDGAKLLRVFCRFAACRLGRALEVASLVAEAAAEGAAACGSDKATAEQQGLQRHGGVARRVAPQLDSCRWKWWRAAVRFS